MQTLVGRSSVFELLASMPEARTDDAALAHLASLCGLAGVEPAPVEPVRLEPVMLPEMPSAAPRIEPVVDTAPVMGPQVRFPRVVRYERIKDEERQVMVPEDLAAIAVLSDAHFAAPSSDMAMPVLHPSDLKFRTENSVWSACLLPGDRKALVSGDKVIQLWDIFTERLIWERKYAGELIPCVFLMPDGVRALAASDDGTIRVLDIVTGACIRSMKSEDRGIWSICALDHQSTVLAAHENGMVAIWDIEAGLCTSVIAAHSGWIRAVCSLPGGRGAVSAGDDGRLQVWNNNGTLERTITAPHALLSVYPFPQGDRALTGSAGSIQVWNLITGQCEADIRERSAPMESVCLVGGGEWAVSTGGDGLTRLWSLTSGECVDVIGYLEDMGTSVCPNSRGTGVLEACGSGAVCYRDLSHYLGLVPASTPRNWAVPVTLDPLGNPEPPPPAVPPTKIPLTPYSRLDPFLRKALGRTGASRVIDVPRVVRAAARVEPMRKLPRKVRRGWALRATVLIDRDATLTPFWDDQSALLQRLRRQRGRAGLTELIVDDPRGPAWDVARNAPSDAHLKSTERGTPVLLLGDCGFLRENADRQRAWHALGVRLRRHGCRTVAIAPCPRDRWEHDAFGAWLMALWDRNARLPVVDDRSPHGGFGPGSLKSDELAGEAPGEDHADNLLALLASAVRIEPALLRAARLMLRSGHADVGTEADAWTHPWIGAASTTAIALDPQQARALRGKPLGDLPLSHPEQVHRDLLALIARHHAVHSPMILIEERLNLLEARGFGEDDPDRDDLLAGIARIVSTLLDDEPLTEGRAAWVLRIVDRLSVEQRKRVPQLAAAYWRALGKLGRRRGEELLPEGFAYKDIGWLLNGEEHRTRLWQVVGGGFVLSPARPGATDLPAGSPIVDITTRLESLQFEGPRPEGRGHERRPIPIGGVVDIRLPATIASEFETWHLDAIPRPAWASAIGRDKYGLWADLEVKGVVQRMRWINPGTFMMGSPEDEPGREKNEILHRVNITHGYWLADTPCTQAFWEAVTGGDNPSHFKSPDRPVEQVSWEHCQRRFLAKLNRLPGRGEPDHVWSLPTEAQWEYACRAGTETALYSGPIEILGENNAPALDPIAWYGGNSGKDFELPNGSNSSKWPNRQYPAFPKSGTHPVRKKIGNPWGLFDMLGNVWEWCEDAHWDYNESRVNDPRGPLEGVIRMRRGGSWENDSRLCRSALRNGAELDHLADSIGFRFALVHRPAPAVPRPSWAADFGEDQFGYWADLTVRGATQRMRWINPGSFMMGSPEDEPGRDKNEILHRVNITHGYWLADTPCTQAFWEAVTGGNNPSHFKSPDRPVEQVSWKDCQVFLTKLAGSSAPSSGMHWALPTEAQWEYACRAGTETPFYFGETISPSQVNYNGNSPYRAEDAKGEYRKKTTEVRSFPANSWGLFDVHGNVWEWCADWYGLYNEACPDDPTGPESGDDRVLRGGCWFNVPRLCRSAFRGGNWPGVRLIAFGFRFAQVPVRGSAGGGQQG